MASYYYGKPEMVNLIKNKLPNGATCLDVGACDGVWKRMIGDHLQMEAVEAFEPNIEKHGLRDLYKEVYACDIRDFRFKWYNLIIFGDIIEHLPVADAQAVLGEAMLKCSDMIVAVPFRLPQDEIYGNPYERHIQDDLTEVLVSIRYPYLEPLLIYPDKYGYYHKKGGVLGGR